MRKLKISVGLLMASLAIVSCTDDSNSTIEEQEIVEIEDSSQAIEGQYIVVYHEDLSNSGKSLVDAKAAVTRKTQQLLQDNSIADAEILFTYGKMLNGAALRMSEDQANRLKSDNRVAFVEQDRVYQFAPPCGTPKGGPCDPGDGGGGDGGGDTSSQATPWGIARVNGVASYTGSNKAYILDSGIDLDHEDLNVNASAGFNAFTSGKDGKSLDDGNGHGTHVAGTIAALNNNVGVIGVAPGATVVPVKVLDSRGSGSYSGVIAGVDFVGANANSGDVANMSLGGPTSDALDIAIQNASQNVKFVLAAGNESANTSTTSPARVNGNNIYTISSMAEGDTWSSFSNYGSSVDYCAPGSAIYSTYKGGAYRTLSGTSMAAPHAAGVLLLGNPSTDGTVSGDPDNNPDPIIVH